MSSTFHIWSDDLGIPQDEAGTVKARDSFIAAEEFIAKYERDDTDYPIGSGRRDATLFVKNIYTDECQKINVRGSISFDYYASLVQS